MSKRILPSVDDEASRESFLVLGDDERCCSCDQTITGGQLVIYTDDDPASSEPARAFRYGLVSRPAGGIGPLMHMNEVDCG